MCLTLVVFDVCLCILAGFEKPSAIQQRAIAQIVSKRDVIAQAQSGTGKTATFSISILQNIDTNLRETQALVLSPTRYAAFQNAQKRRRHGFTMCALQRVHCGAGTSELAVQIQKVVLALGDYMSVQCHACIGGTSINEDIKKLDYGQHVVSGTPGRCVQALRVAGSGQRGLTLNALRLSILSACTVCST